MPTLNIDGTEIEVPDGITLLQACEMAGSEIPRFSVPLLLYIFNMNLNAPYLENIESVYLEYITISINSIWGIYLIFILFGTLSVWALESFVSRFLLKEA